MTLLAWIRRLPRLRMHVIRNIDGVLQLRLERYSAILLYFHASHISDEALAALDTYVTEGGGLVALHSAAASFEEVPAYSAILGGRFLDHGPIASYSVRPAKEEGADSLGRPSSVPSGFATAGLEEGGTHPSKLVPTFSPMGPFTIRDELYIHEYNPDNSVHFVTETENGREPVAWSRIHGRGRVFYLAPGHRAQTLRHPSFRNILRRGISWAMNVESNR